MKLTESSYFRLNLIYLYLENLFSRNLSLDKFIIDVYLLRLNLYQNNLVLKDSFKFILTILHLAQDRNHSF
jgi:hypothetical protein